jgi:hypothetical protein
MATGQPTPSVSSRNFGGGRTPPRERHSRLSEVLADHQGNQLRYSGRGRDAPMRGETGMTDSSRAAVRIARSPCLRVERMAR